MQSFNGWKALLATTAVSFFAATWGSGCNVVVGSLQDRTTDGGSDVSTSDSASESSSGVDSSSDAALDAPMVEGGANGTACTLDVQCGSGFCANPTGTTGVCCNSACTGTCQACTLALTGSPNGTCAAITPGTSAPTGQCTAAPPCGNTGNCTTEGVCEDTTAGTSCGSASCVANMFIPAGAGTCNWTGMCSPGTAALCMGGFICASGTACKTACASDGDCASLSDYCNASSACAPRGAAGATCSGNDQCMTQICDVAGSGHCCTEACTTGGTCGATACSTSGACTYPTGSTSCGSASCSGSMLTPADTCNGTGTCTPGTPALCSGGLICASGTACKTTCASDGDCASSSDYCNASGACVARGATGVATCTTNDQCTSGFCANGYCCNSACSGTCQACSTALTGAANGTCSNETAGKSCGSGGQVCSAGGACGCPSGDTLCGSTCTNTQSGDPANCGTCGHSCTTCGGASATCGTITPNMCDPVNLSTGRGGAGLAIDSTNVYWTDSIGDGVWQCAKSGCGTGGSGAHQLAIDSNGPGSIVTDGTNVYWVDASNVMQNVVGGNSASAITLASGQTTVESLAVSAGYVYWAVGEPAAGRNPWWYSGPVQKCAVTTCGNNPKTLTQTSDGPPQVAVDPTGTYVYWTSYYGFEAAIQNQPIVCISTSGGGCTSPATSVASSSVLALALDTNNVYWSYSAGEVMQCSLAGGTTGTTIATGASVTGSDNGIPALAVDSTTVYWLNAVPSTGSVVAVPIGGGAPQTIAVNQNMPQSIAVDSSCVYWTNINAGQVMKVAKP
jgi:hypothetical protein